MAAPFGQFPANLRFSGALMLPTGLLIYFCTSMSSQLDVNNMNNSAVISEAV